jgi:hypothetical protein
MAQRLLQMCPTELSFLCRTSYGIRACQEPPGIAWVYGYLSSHSHNLPQVLWQFGQFLSHFDDCPWGPWVSRLCIPAVRRPFVFARRRESRA